MFMLKKTTLTLTTALALSSSSAFADLGDKLDRNWDKSTGISKLYLGANNTSVDFGLSHERRKGNIGLDFMAFYSAGNDSANSVQSDSQTLVSSSFMYHVEDLSNADVFLGTGLAATFHDDVRGTGENDTTFGPMFKIGSSYYLNSDWSVGLEYIIAQNWTDDSLSSQNTYGLFSLGYTY